MSCLRIYQDNYIDATIVSNRFIDEYMAEANDAQLKIYLYLLRMMNAGRTFSISGIADAFNHTEKDVMRALKYWEKCKVLSLEYDNEKNLVGIHLLELENKEEPAVSKAPVVSLLPRQEEKNEEAEILPEKAEAKSAASYAVQSPSKEGNKPPQAAPSAFAKPSYTLDELKAFQEKESTAQLLFIAEQYLGRTLSPSDMKSILFFSDHLHFSDDLIDYLLQYCVERGKKDFRYMEKVAISWAEANISTPGKKRNSSAAGVRNMLLKQILLSNPVKEPFWPPTGTVSNTRTRSWPPGRKPEYITKPISPSWTKVSRKTGRQSPHRIVPLINIIVLCITITIMTPWSRSFYVTESVW